MSASSKPNLQQENVKVYVRLRPVKKQEQNGHSQTCVDLSPTEGSITVKNHHEKTFAFDGTLDWHLTQLDVYETVVRPLVDKVLQGYNCTILAYGQTGTGKTYTIEGIRAQAPFTWPFPREAGFIPRALRQIFYEVGHKERTVIKVSFLEVFKEELFDLLADDKAHDSKLQILEDPTAGGSVVVRGLEELVVQHLPHAFELMQLGISRRQQAETPTNAFSSRSQTIFTITVTSTDEAETGRRFTRTGKFNLVDLTANEIIGHFDDPQKSVPSYDDDNLSILTLGRVIAALVERSAHVPYSNSVLTRLLQDSLGGSTKTTMIATISPEQANFNETLATLEYAFRARRITNTPTRKPGDVDPDVMANETTDERGRVCGKKDDFHVGQSGKRASVNEGLGKRADYEYLLAMVDAFKDKLSLKIGELLAECS